MMRTSGVISAVHNEPRTRAALRLEVTAVRHRVTVPERSHTCCLLPVDRIGSFRFCSRAWRPQSCENPGARQPVAAQTLIERALPDPLCGSHWPRPRTRAPAPGRTLGSDAEPSALAEQVNESARCVQGKESATYAQRAERAVKMEVSDSVDAALTLALSPGHPGRGIGKAGRGLGW